MNTFLGIDGGGSKTDFLLVDAAGNVLASVRGGAAYYLQTGLEALQSLLHEGIRATLAQASLAATDLSFTCIGLPAYGEDSRLTERLDAIAAPLLPRQRYRCVNDMVCGWAGALQARDGINIVAGTGSIGYGEYAGRCARAGGWGELFSDEGSAYWVAREALNLFSRMSDGRAPKGGLHTALRRQFGLNADLDLCAAVYGPPALSRGDIAALAPLVAAAARAGDAAAHRLFVTAAQELASIVHAVRGSLAVPAEAVLPVSYSGGLFNLGELVIEPLVAALRHSPWRYEFSPPALSPGAGAALYAAKLAGTMLTSAALERLVGTHSRIAEFAA